MYAPTAEVLCACVRLEDTCSVRLTNVHIFNVYTMVPLVQLIRKWIPVAKRIEQTPAVGSNVLALHAVTADDHLLLLHRL